MSGMKKAREVAGLSQSELARRMVAAGFSTWSQTMVSRREDNELTIRWHEGVALRQIIGYPEVQGDSPADSITQADALAYRRILSVIGERKAAAGGIVTGILKFGNDSEGVYLPLDPAMKERHRGVIREEIAAHDRWQASIIRGASHRIYDVPLSADGFDGDNPPGANTLAG